MSSYTRLNGGSTGKKRRSLTVRKAPRNAFMLTTPTKSSCRNLVRSRNFNYNRPVISTNEVSGNVSRQSVEAKCGIHTPGSTVNYIPRRVTIKTEMFMLYGIGF